MQISGIELSYVNIVKNPADVCLTNSEVQRLYVIMHEIGRECGHYHIIG
jgi:hypothetical protein